jgi:hypothetical protein
MTGNLNRALYGDLIEKRTIPESTEQSALTIDAFFSGDLRGLLHVYKNLTAGSFKALMFHQMVMD